MRTVGVGNYLSLNNSKSHAKKSNERWQKNNNRKRNRLGVVKKLCRERPTSGVTMWVNLISASIFVPRMFTAGHFSGTCHGVVYAGIRIH